MVSGTILQTLAGASSAPEDFLRQLKELKNSIIGNASRKVALAQEKGLASFLVVRLSSAADPALSRGEDEEKRMEVVNELCVILGTLANVGEQTLFALLSAQLANTLLESIASLWSFAQPQLDSAAAPHPPSRAQTYALNKALPSALRALRNICEAAADVCLGRMWGVEVPPAAVALEKGHGSGHSESGAHGERGDAGRAVASRWGRDDVRRMAKGVVAGMFEPSALAVLVPIMTSSIPSTSRFPLYQLYAHLAVLPSHRHALAARDHPSYRPRTVKTPRVQFASSPHPAISLDALAGQLVHQLAGASPGPLVVHLCETVLGTRAEGQAGNAKVVASALDLLAAMCRDETAMALEVIVGMHHAALKRDPAMDQPSSSRSALPSLQNLAQVFRELIGSRSPGVPISAVNCLANIAKATNVKGATLTLTRETQLLDTLVRLIGPLDESTIHACFIISHLTADEEDIQRAAHESECLARLIAATKSADKEDPAKPIATSVRARLKEGCFLAMASIAMIYEPPRATIVEGGMLPIIHAALSHPSYGVRAAACQLTRALSRSVAILRTSLVDGGVATKILELLKEEEARLSSPGHDPREDSNNAVLVAGTAALCNLITEFSPMQTLLIDDGGVELLVRLSVSNLDQARMNAVWALKNMLFKNKFENKLKVVEALGWDGMRAQITHPSPDVQEQGLALMRNFVCEGTEEEISALFAGLGEQDLFNKLLLPKLQPEVEVEPMEQAIYVLVNVALGSDSHREAILSRRPVLQGLKMALSHDSPMVRIAAIRAIGNLIESNDQQQLPRQDVLSRLKPLMLEDQIQLHTADPIHDVSAEALKVLALMKMPGVTGSRAHRTLGLAV